MHRRKFISTTAGMAASLLPLGGLSEIWSQSLLMDGPSWIELNGRPAGWATLRGGDTILSSQPVDRGAGGILPPPAAALRFVRNLEVQFARGMSAGFYRWVGSCMERSQPTSALIGTAHGKYWAGAYVTRLVIPELRLDRDNAVQMLATIHATRTGDRPHARTDFPATASDLWPQNGFRLHIAGLEDLCRRVQGMSAMEFARPLATNVLDAQRRNSIRAGAPALPALRLRVPEADRKQWRRKLESVSNLRSVLSFTSREGTPWLNLELFGLSMNPKVMPNADFDLQFSFAAAHLIAHK